VVEFRSDSVELVLSERGQIGVPVQVLAQQSVRVLVGAALPWMVRVAEEHRQSQRRGDCRMLEAPGPFPGSGAQPCHPTTTTFRAKTRIFRFRRPTFDFFLLWLETKDAGGEQYPGYTTCRVTQTLARRPKPIGAVGRVPA
jgi:hypothetical protein